MPTFFTFLILFVVPFIIFPFGATSFETPKVIIAQGLIILLFFLQQFTNQLTFHIPLAQKICYGAIFLLSIVDILFLKSDISLTGNIFRLQGIFLLWFLMVFSLLSSRVTFQKISYWIFTIVLLVEVLLMFFLPINESNRYIGTLGEPNALSAFAIFVWPFSFFAMKKFDKKEIINTALFLLLVGVILLFSGSKSGIVAFGIECMFILLTKFKFSLKKAFVICLVLYFLSYLLPFLENIPYENRVQIWQSALIAGTKNPFIGWGIGNNEIALTTSSKVLNTPVQYYYVDSSHNIFLDWWVTGGIIGLESIAALFIISFVSFFNKKNLRDITLLLGILCVLSFNPASVVGLLGLWWLFGQASIIN